MNSWCNLPLELLIEVFNKYVDYKDLIQCAVVCKSWKNPAQDLIFKTVRCINKSSIEKIYRTILVNPKFGLLVQKMVLLMNSPLDNRGCNHLLFLERLLYYTPNLKEFHCPPGSHYTILLPVLIDNALPKLTEILSPCLYENVTDYTTCAILMKDRIEKLKITDGSKSNDLTQIAITRFLRLYDRLGQFKKLNKLTIEKLTTNELRFLAQTDNVCPSLGILQLYLTRDFRGIDNHVITEPIIPRPNMKHLTYHAVLDNVVLSFITQKYPHLDFISLEANRKYPVTLDSLAMSHITCYLAQIGTVIIKDLQTEPEIMNHIIDTLWKNLESTYVAFKYEPRENDDSRTARLNFSKKFKRQSTLITYSGNLRDAEHTDIVERHGKSIKKLHLIQDKEVPPALPIHKLRGPFIADTLRYCPNLEDLRIAVTRLDRILLPQDEIFSSKVTLQALEIDCKKLCVEALRDLSMLVSKIKLFELAVSNFFNDGDTSFTPNKSTINMTNTDIDELRLINGSRANHVYLRLFHRGQDHYYMYNHNAMRDLVFKPSHKQEFDDNEGRLDTIQVFIACQSVKSVKIGSVSETFRLIELIT